MRRPRLVALALALLLTASACAGRTDVRVLSDGELPDDLYARPAPTSTAEPSQRLTVYLTRGSNVWPATRVVPATSSRLEDAIRALLAGPTPEEMAGEIQTAIPAGVGLLSTDVSDGIASINLSREFERGAEQSQLILRIGQVVYTATELAFVSRVRFKIDGESVDVLAQDGTVRAEPVTRADYDSLALVP